MEITNQVASSINSYFYSLSQFGYKKRSDVDKLLVYSFIEELLNGDMRFFITEDDYRLIENALSCLYGSSCLIPYPLYISNTSLFGLEGTINRPRLTEGSSLRFTEDNIVRTNNNS